jgi:uridine kinase
MPAADPAARVLDVVRRRPATLHGRCRVVVVDGPAGSGKTTLAGEVAAAATVGVTVEENVVHVVHLDDLYEGWRGVLTVGPRVSSLLRSLEESGVATYRRYDWHLEEYAEQHRVELPDLLVLEGVGSCHPDTDDLVTLRVWVEAPREVRLRRGLERDGEHLRSRWLQFLDDEQQVHRRDRTRGRAEVVVDGTTGAVRVVARDPHAPR